MENEHFDVLKAAAQQADNLFQFIHSLDDGQLDMFNQFVTYASFLSAEQKNNVLYMTGGYINGLTDAKRGGPQSSSATVDKMASAVTDNSGGTGSYL